MFLCNCNLMTRLKLFETDKKCVLFYSVRPFQKQLCSVENKMIKLLKKEKKEEHEAHKQSNEIIMITLIVVFIEL